MTSPEVLEWDSEFWGVRVGRATSLDGLPEWAIANTVEFVCLLVSTELPDEIQEAEERGYRTTDVRVRLSRPVSRYPSPAREFASDDVPSLVQIARGAHRITRFYADPALDNARCDDLYEKWIRQSCEGWAQTVLVVGPEGGPSGYVTIHLEKRVASIGLIAVAEQERHRRRGTQLVLGAANWAFEHGARGITVVTQGRNVAAQRLFQRCGFLTVSTEVWLHKHYEVPA